MPSSIYPEYYKGKFRLIKNIVGYFLLFVYFTASWLKWYRGPDITNQALYIDLVGRKILFFGIQIWSDEVYYIMAILILSALGLFIVTSIWGRVWCGYACPQTVFTDIFVKIERFWQGDRNARIKLNEATLEDNSGRLYKKCMTHISWVIVAFLFAYGWVCYFYGAQELTTDIIHFTVTTNGVIWLCSLTFSTYLFAAILREKVCIFMCPYGRFQSAMIDKSTRIVTYHEWRGEPRGYLVKDSSSLIKEKFGDCIDCMKCFFACPMGIDIRNGLQMACIGCGLCIDACDTVMKKLHRQTGLIAYDSLESAMMKQDGSYNKISSKIQLRSLLYGIVFVVAFGITIYSLVNKSDLVVKINKMQDPVFIILPDNSVRNEYLLKMENRTYYNKSVNLTLQNGDDALFAVQKLGGHALEYVNYFDFHLKLEEELELPIFVKIPVEKLQKLQNNLDDNGNIKMKFIITVKIDSNYENDSNEKLEIIEKNFIFNFKQ